MLKIKNPKDSIEYNGKRYYFYSGFGSLQNEFVRKSLISELKLKGAEPIEVYIENREDWAIYTANDLK